MSVVGDVDIRLIDNVTIEEFKTVRLKQVAKSSVNVDLRSLKAVFSLALSWNIIEKNPVKGVRLLFVHYNSDLHNLLILFIKYSKMILSNPSLFIEG